MRLTKLQAQNDKVELLTKIEYLYPIILSASAFIIFLAKDCTAGDAYRYAMQFLSRLRSDTQKEAAESIVEASQRLIREDIYLD